VSELCSSVSLARGGAVTMAIDSPDDAVPGKTPVLVLAHGAGNDLASAFLEWFATALSLRGLVVVRFNFPYKERVGTRPPDRMDVLVDTYEAILEAQERRTGSPPGPLFLGGKSMGGRVAAALVAQDRAWPAGFVFLGYPLHKPGETEDLRTDDLAKVQLPMLFVQGTRDPFGSPDEVKSAAQSLSLDARLHVVQGGDHSFVLPRAQQDRQQAEMTAAADAIAAFTRSALAVKRR
jgi:predicted alpha/beta-hydrolase family hydrolase